MFVSFDILPDSARVWIYQSNRKFTEKEQDLIRQEVENFCEHWEAHGVPIRSSVKIFHHQFIVLAADESFNTASGCSIDTTLRLFQQMEATFGCTLLDRTQIAFLENEEVKLYPQKGLKELFVSGTLNKSNLAFNNVVTSKGELNEQWLVPVEKSWIRRLLPKDTVAS
jgi:hypothetical protein